MRIARLMCAGVIAVRCSAREPARRSGTSSRHPPGRGAATDVPFHHQPCRSRRDHSRRQRAVRSRPDRRRCDHPRGRQAADDPAVLHGRARSVAAAWPAHRAELPPRIARIAFSCCCSTKGIWQSSRFSASSAAPRQFLRDAVWPRRPGRHFRRRQHVPRQAHDQPGGSDCGHPSGEVGDRQPSSVAGPVSGVPAHPERGRRLSDRGRRARTGRSARYRGLS